VPIIGVGGLVRRDLLRSGKGGGTMGGAWTQRWSLVQQRVVRWLWRVNVLYVMVIIIIYLHISYIYLYVYDIDM
jgi:membrane-anchored glycerophosphoryl diester phosphodiesterase (GDPDase)